MASIGLISSLLQTLSVSSIVAVGGFLYKWRSDVSSERGRHRDDIKLWSDAAISTLCRTDSLYIGVSPQTGAAEKAKLQAELSAQIDIGRTYFPNKPHKQSDHGYRRRIYDWLIYAHQILETKTDELSPEAKVLIRSLRKHFIDDRQEAIRAIEQFGPVKKSNMDRFEHFGFMNWSMSHEVLLSAEDFIRQSKARA